MSNRCWICGRTADSAEHRIKRSDLVRAYGRGSYKGEHGPAHISEGRQTLVQGPNSKVLKYEPSLCYQCNTTRTQPMDQAYDTFVDWVYANEKQIVERRIIDFFDVFGDGYENGQRLLYQYLAKSLGCRIVSAGGVVPLDVKGLLFKKKFGTWLKISFAINEDILLMPVSDRAGFIGKGELYTVKKRWPMSYFSPYQWWEHVSWLYIYYWYRRWPQGPTGALWTADARYLYLGAISPLSEEQRSDLKREVGEA